MKRIGLQLLLLFLGITYYSQSQKQKGNSFEIKIDNLMSDDDFAKDIADAKKFDFDLSVSGIKRNDKKEITTIKISYKDKDGNSGNYNVSGDEPIQPISIRKQFNGKGKGFVNINTLSGKQNSLFADNFDGFNGFGSMNKFFDNDMMKEFIEGNGFQFNEGLGDKGMKSFQFNFGGGNNEEEMLKNNPDLKLEEEKIEDDGTITKKYSDGKGSTFMFSEKSSKMEGGSAESLDKFKEELKSSKKVPNDNMKKELDDLRKELDALKKDLKENKNSKEKK